MAPIQAPGEGRFEMPPIVKLRDVINEMNPMIEECSAYLNRRTGELTTLTDEELTVAETDDPGRLEDWQREALPKLREVLQSDDWLVLPDQFEINEWEIMKRYSESVDRAEWRHDLLAAIHGPGAFHSFRATTDRLDLTDRWYRFRDAAIGAIAIEWLDSHGITYVREPESGA